MLFTAADQARKVDPQLAAKYQRLMAGDRHHDSAICHLATQLVTRIATCMRTGQPYVIRDVDGTPITEAEGRAIVEERYQLDSPRVATTSGTSGCETAASRRRTRSHRSRKALQHPDLSRPA